MTYTIALMTLACSVGQAPVQAPNEPQAVIQDPAVRAPVDDGDPAGTDRLSLRTDFVVYYLRQIRVPALLTTGPTSSGGVLGANGTELLYGDDRLTSRHDDRYIGVRPEFDYWFDEGHTIGLNGSAFFLERDSTHYTYPWQSGTLLARPYTDAATGKQDAFIIAGPDGATGDLSGAFNAYSRIELFGEDGSVRCLLAQGQGWRLDGLVGGRFLQMRERLDLTGVSRVLPDQSVLLSQTDHFDTFDKFFGVQTGVIGVWQRGRWSVESKTTIALGGDDQEIRNYGDQLYQTPKVRLTEDYGVYVLPSNRGTFERGAVDFVTETTFNVAYALNGHTRVRVGYTFLLWDNPVRPGDQVQPINLSQVASGGLVGPAKPTVPFKEDTFWAQGFNAGLELHW